MASHQKSLYRAAVAARLFAVVGLIVPIGLAGERSGFAGLLTMCVAWLLACLIAAVPRSLVLVAAEAGTVGVVCGLTIHNTPGLLAALAVGPFVAALGRGPRGMSAALSAQLIGLTAALVYVGSPTRSESLDIFSWLVTGFGLGLVASFVHSVAGTQDDDPLAAYREARSLIRELLDVSRSLTSGLDAVSLGGQILAEVRDRLPTASLAVHVPHDGGLMPLVSEGVPTDNELPEALAARVAGGSPLCFDGHAFALPLTTDSEVVAVVAGTLSDDLDPESIGFRDTVRQLPEALMPTTLRLDTALLFATLKHEATADERGRMAREMHDGVAQDIAYLGYAVDALAARAESTEQQEQLVALRQRITSVVAEVRRSVLTLRTQVGASESLGAGIGRLARHLGEVSGVPIRVTVDERTHRLRPEIEAELLRIAQEAMNNAVRHAEPSQIDVRCRVDPPRVELVVTDDGRGLGGGRSDSHGLTIMRERARLVGAELEVANRPEGGVAVSVRIGTAPYAGRPSVSSDSATALNTPPEPEEHHEPGKPAAARPAH
jgi:signal transduction histidine kinase